MRESAVPRSVLLGLWFVSVVFTRGVLSATSLTVTASTAFTFTGDVDHEAGDYLEIQNLGIVVNQASFLNGFLAQITNDAGGTFDNGPNDTYTFGNNVQNYGNVDNNGLVINETSGNIYNYGTFTNQSGGTLSNSGWFYNHSYGLHGGTFTNQSGGS